jgi:DNA-binding NarL/FixJ family response regulator
MTVISVCIISTVFIYRCFKEKNMHVKQLQTDLSYAGFDAEQSKQRLNELKQSVTVAMNKQFDLWHLSQAESDIALFLLKGLSLKEIATLRKCSISTVRHQASMVYQKSGLEGRAQLSSFFIEELLSDDNLDTFQQLT